MFDINTDWGQIHFSKDIIRKICVDAVDSCEGKAVILNFRGKGRNKGEVLFQQKKHHIPDDIIMEGDDDSLEITIYIVIRFGASIRGCAEAIIDHIYAQTEKVFGRTPVKVTVINTGTASKDIMARHMEFSKSRGDERIREM